MIVLFEWKSVDYLCKSKAQLKSEIEKARTVVKNAAWPAAVDIMATVTQSSTWHHESSVPQGFQDLTPSQRVSQCDNLGS